MTLSFGEFDQKNLFEDIHQLEEKLVVFNGGKQSGQVIFMAGGAGSGKGFSINNFIDSRNAKIIDVDELKRLMIKVSKDSSKWHSGITDTKKRERIDISDFKLKNTPDVVSLHDYIAGLGIKDTVVKNILIGLGENRNEKDLPNILFDITGKSMKQFTKFLPLLQKAGYKSNSIHVVWVLQKFSIAVKQNAGRARKVAKLQMFLTHNGAGQSMYDRMANEYSSFKKVGIDGQFTVIFNDPKYTVFATDADGNSLINANNPGAITKVFNSETGEWEKSKKTVVVDFRRVTLKREGKPFSPREGAMEMVTREMLNALPTIRTAMFAGSKKVKGERETIKALGITKGDLRTKLASLNTTSTNTKHTDQTNPKKTRKL